MSPPDVVCNVTVKLGSALEAVGQTNAARAQYQKASDIGRRMRDTDPKNEPFENSYALALRARADLLAKSGDVPGALALRRIELEVFRNILAADPQSPRRQGIYVQTLASIGELVVRQRREEARRAYREAMGIFKDLAARGKASPEDLSNYAEHLLACALAEFADPAQALAVARRAVELTHATQPAYLEQLARAYWVTGDPAGALAAERKAFGAAARTLSQTQGGASNTYEIRVGSLNDR